MLGCIVPRRSVVAFFGCTLALVGWLLLAPPTPVAAATYTVNALTDTGAGSGTTGDLRFAITHVNAGNGGDTITFSTTGTITLTSALPHLTKGVTITGPTSGAGITVDGNNAVVVFTVDLGTVNLSNLTIQHGNAAAAAAASSTTAAR